MFLRHTVVSVVTFGQSISECVAVSGSSGVGRAQLARFPQFNQANRSLVLLVCPRLRIRASKQRVSSHGRTEEDQLFWAPSRRARHLGSVIAPRSQHKQHFRKEQSFPRILLRLHRCRNYPFHNVFNPTVAALFSGNAIIIKAFPLGACRCMLACVAARSRSHDLLMQWLAISATLRFGSGPVLIRLVSALLLRRMCGEASHVAHPAGRTNSREGLGIRRLVHEVLRQDPAGPARRRGGARASRCALLLKHRWELTARPGHSAKASGALGMPLRPSFSLLLLVFEQGEAIVAPKHRLHCALSVSSQRCFLVWTSARGPTCHFQTLPRE